MEASEDVVVKKSAFAQARVPLTLVFLALAAFGAYYAFFFERKTAYYSERNARVVAGLADQVRKAIDATADYAKQAANVSEQDRKELFLIDSAQGERAQMPAALFRKIEPCIEDVPRRWAEPTPNGLRLNFIESRTNPPVREEKSLLAGPDRRAAATAEKCRKKELSVKATIDLKPVLDPQMRQSSADVFDSVFLLDGLGNVIYQQARGGDSGNSGVTIVRLREMTERLLLTKDRAVRVDELLATSRQTSVRVGDDDYELFSAPLRSSIATANADDTWVVCGIVRQTEFRSRSLAISVTLVSAIAAAILLLLLSWPYLKVTLVSASHRISKVDVVLLGICGILASGILSLTVLDWLTYTRLEEVADQQLEQLASDIAGRFKSERHSVNLQIAQAKKWAEAQLLAKKVDDIRNKNLLTQMTLSYPYIQSFALVDKNGWQRVKWFVDGRATPMVQVQKRTYFSAARYQTSEYREFGDGKMAIQSVKSMTTGLPEVDFGQRTAVDPDDQTRPPDGSHLLKSRDHDQFHDEFPVITMTVPDALAIGRPVLPQYFGFAVIDEDGNVLFHSTSYRNTVENFFAEADRDRRLRSAVASRRNETMNIRYWGEDYRASVRPMDDLPWTVVTFREKRGLRTINTEALLATLLFLLVLVGPCLLAFIGLVLLVRPRYDARWLWPDARRVPDYVSLAACYGALLVAAGVFMVFVRAGTLVLFPFWFVPTVLLITYLRVANPKRGPRRLVPLAAVVVLLAVAALSVANADLEPLFGTAQQNMTPVVGGVILVGILAAFAAHRRARINGGRDDQLRHEAALPLAYCGAAFLLLVLTSLVPTAAFFKAAYGVEMTSFVKATQLDFARSLQNRYWRIAEEYNELHGERKHEILPVRWMNEDDLYYKQAFETSLDLRAKGETGPPSNEDESAFPTFIERFIPHYSEASIKTRELIHNQSSDRQWWWTNSNAGRIRLALQKDRFPKPFTIESAIPTVVLGLGGPLEPGRAVLYVLLLLALLGANYWIARFIARRVFLVDVVNPRSFAGGVTWKRHLICYPCDHELAKQLSAGHERIDLRVETELARAETLPQSFTKEPYEEYVLIEGVDYRFATGKRAEIVRGLLERLTRNGDRTVVLCPTKMTVITNGFLQGSEAAEWSKTLATFVWVDGNQSASDRPERSDSGHYQPTPKPAPAKSRWRRVLQGFAGAFGFASYVEQITDNRRTASETIRQETEHDPYLEWLVQGLKSEAAFRDQVLDEISERAENYYTGLWHSCNKSEKVVLLQVAQTGLVNEKMRKDVRRLLARGLIRRDPRLRLMNETFRRFTVAQSNDAVLASELEPDFFSDTWQRFRVPFFGSVGVLALFFLMTQHELFDATIAAVTGLTATIPALAKILSVWSNRSSVVK
jgi:hypothetical protein